jgi:enoyl-CoA hydratase/carnithine racemase
MNSRAASAGGVTRTDPADGVAMLRLDHEARLGALTPRMRTELRDAWLAIGADPTIRAVVLTGTGRGFSTGLDLTAASEGDDPASDHGDGGEELPSFGMNPHGFGVWLPYIVAVNGVCAGGGFHLLTEADVVIASEGASFLDPHVTVGQVSALEPIALLRRMPLEAVLRMVVLGRAGRMDAAAALRTGLVSEVVAEDALQSRAVELASIAATGSPATIEASKRAIWASMQLGLDDALKHGWGAIRAHWVHPDYLEGVRAFAEGRPPVWAPRQISSDVSP